MFDGVILDFQSRFKRSCKHGRYRIDESLSHVECKICGKEVSPMFVLIEMSKAESTYRERLQSLTNEIEKLKEKTKCKCQHCKKMTAISRLK